MSPNMELLFSEIEIDVPALCHYKDPPPPPPPPHAIAVRKACIIHYGINDLKTISFQFCCIVCIFLDIWVICLVFRKSACPFGQVKTKIHLPESPFIKNSLARTSKQVLMAVPGIREIHNLDPQPHRHCMLAPRAFAPRVTRCNLGKYWSHDFFQKEAGRMLPGIQACATGFAAISVWSRARETTSSYLGQIGCQGDGVSRQPAWGTQVIYDS